jgi:hypothetical protein
MSATHPQFGRQQQEVARMVFSDEDLSDIVGDSNGRAFRVTETRTGPPLSYIAEKAHTALLSAHSVFGAIRHYVPDDLPQPEGALGTPFSTKEDGLLSPAWNAFSYGLTSYLALQNMLDLANDHELVQHLLSMTHGEFVGWLNRVASEGSVAGV